MKMHRNKYFSNYEFRAKGCLCLLDWRTCWPTRFNIIEYEICPETGSSTMTVCTSWSRRRRSRSCPPERSGSQQGTFTADTSTITQDYVGPSRITQNSVGERSCKKRCANVDVSKDEQPDAHPIRLLLINAEFNHLPEPIPTKEGECQLHKWVLHDLSNTARSHSQVKDQLSYCPICNKLVCVRCYKILHTIMIYWPSRRIFKLANARKQLAEIMI